MRFPLRKQLFIAQKPVHAPPSFTEDLHIAVLHAEHFLTQKNFSEESVRTWREKLHSDVLKHCDRNHTLANAMLGIALTTVSQSILQRGRERKIAHILGAESQQCMTIAFTELDRAGRATYMRFADVETANRMIGAMSVTRIARALTENGAICYLPTPEEDAMAAIDLLCEIEHKHGACLQIKTGIQDAQRIITASTDTHRRLLDGTAFFNRQYSLRWIPVHVAVPITPSDVALIDDRIHALGKTVINIIQDANED